MTRHSFHSLWTGGVCEGDIVSPLQNKLAFKGNTTKHLSSLSPYTGGRYTYLNIKMIRLETKLCLLNIILLYMKCRIVLLSKSH